MYVYMHVYVPFLAVKTLHVVLSIKMLLQLSQYALNK